MLLIKPPELLAIIIFNLPEAIVVLFLSLVRKLSTSKKLIWITVSLLFGILALIAFIVTWILEKRGRKKEE
jgi:cytochrome bd-type quinol oxidase subunit 1